MRYSNDGSTSIKPYNSPSGSSDLQKPVSATTVIEDKISKLNLGSFSEEIKEEESSKNDSTSSNDEVETGPPALGLELKQSVADEISRSRLSNQEVSVSAGKDSREDSFQMEAKAQRHSFIREQNN